MGLVQIFESPLTSITFEPFDGDADIYYPWLVTPPRVYQEEPQALSGSGTLGIVWADPRPTDFSQSSINFFSVLNRNPWPSWGSKRWRMDGVAGEYPYADTSQPNYDTFQTTYSPGGITMDRFSFEPTGATGGRLWEFSGHPILDDDGAIAVDPATMAADDTMTLLPDAFTGHSADRFESFAIHTYENRVWIRWLTNEPGEISVYNLATKALLHTIYTPGQVEHLVLDGDGFIYAFDENDWICIYDYDGTFHGAMRNPRQEDWPGGYTVGWDPFYKRFLLVPGTASAVDGSSTLQVIGYAPRPKEVFLTPPIPRSVPRKGRTITVWARLVGDGAESMGGRQVDVTGDAEGTIGTDNDGDAILTATPATTAAQSITVSVEETTT